MIPMSGSTSSSEKQDSSFPTDQVVTCSHIAIIRVDELRWSYAGRGLAVIVGAPISWSRVDLWSSLQVLVVRSCFELDVEAIAEVDLVFRTIRTGE